MRGWLSALALLVFLPAAAIAQGTGFPALYDVTGVAADDVLNIRSAPGASSPVIGSFAPDEAGIEVTAQDETGRWGRVNTGETAGWASLRYLQRQEQGDWLALEEPLFCYGTEPFWSLNIDIARARWSEAAGEELHFTILYPAPGRGHPGKSGFAAATLAGTEMPVQPIVGFTGVLTAQSCSDGMSDAAYGISLDILMQRDGTAALYSGCCSLAR